MAVRDARALGPVEGAVDVLIIGGGAAGLTAALAARDAGAQALVAERDAAPRGTSAMSTGLIPAAGTPEQAAAGIADSPQAMAADILARSGGRADAAVVGRLAEESAASVAWLQRHGVPLSLVTGFTYPGHGVPRMMGTPNRTGEELMGALAQAAEAAGAIILTEATAAELWADPDGRIRAVTFARPGGATETVACGALVLACGGFAGAADLVARHIPEAAGAVVHSHPGVRGDGVRWGEALGAELADMDAWQGHAGLAAGHGVPILWATMVEGGIQVNRAGNRFADESRGYSVQAADVVRQPGGIAFSIWDSRIEAIMAQFDDHRDAHRAGAIVRADSVEALAAALRLPAAALADALDEAAAHAASGVPDRFGRRFLPRPALAPPYFAARVQGALFHTQGGLAVTPEGRVCRAGGGLMPNLFAAGGAARGLSGPGAAGYIAGNGLLSATGLGRLAGLAAARLALGAATGRHRQGEAAREVAG
jgi:fumarate reductase flavoprotein subunit